MQKQMEKTEILESIHEMGKSISTEALLEKAKEYASALVTSAPDLEQDLALRYSFSLFKRLHEPGIAFDKNIVKKGKEVFYSIGKDVYGPTFVSFVNDLLENADFSTLLVFPQRDANIFYLLALHLKSEKPDVYKIPMQNILNPAITRKMYVENANIGMLKEYLQQLGFGKNYKIAIADVGSWGTMVNEIKKMFPNQSISVDFFYSHMPNSIHGFANYYATGISDSYLETFADSIEAIPKSYASPWRLVHKNGKIAPDYSGLLIPSPFISQWSEAFTYGVLAAAEEFLRNNKKANISEELSKWCKLVDEAKTGTFTGMLPEHTETWPEGENWKKNWQWGHISSLIFGD